jgi:hypothetical protein
METVFVQSCQINQYLFLDENLTATYVQICNYVKYNISLKFVEVYMGRVTLYTLC